MSIEEKFSESISTSLSAGTIEALATQLLEWQQRCGRHDLPWQHDKTPYTVWVSEIMLQQTQVAKVRQYYCDFIAKWPTLTSLALASVDDVLAMWSGLGYYRRAHNLHKAAVLCHARHLQCLPETFAELAALPGIGRSTAGAILSLGHNLPGAILEANSKRVFSRLTGTIGDKELWATSESFVKSLAVQYSAAQWTQALMDLGAIVCGKEPSCSICPWQKMCTFHKHPQAALVPKKVEKKRLKRKETWHMVLPIMQRQAQPTLYGLIQRTESIWHKLYAPKVYQIDKDHVVAEPPPAFLPQPLVRVIHKRWELTHISLELRIYIDTNIETNIDSNIDSGNAQQKYQPHYAQTAENMHWVTAQDQNIGMPSIIKDILLELDAD